MLTVVRRTFRSSPCRDTGETWTAIVRLLTSQTSVWGAEAELLGVLGIAASLIADQSPRESPIIVTGGGPRCRIYCVYDDDALDDSTAEEEPLSFDPLNGDWRVSLPCGGDDLGWVQAALAKSSTRITARDQSAATSVESDTNASRFTLDAEAFLRS